MTTKVWPQPLIVVRDVDSQVAYVHRPRRQYRSYRDGWLPNS